MNCFYISENEYRICKSGFTVNKKWDGNDKSKYSAAYSIRGKPLNNCNKWNQNLRFVKNYLCETGCFANLRG
jgi:hypothetical protein